MRRTNAFTLSFAFFSLLALAVPTQAQESPIAGAWITTSWEGFEGEPQPGLLIFTETNYSMMFVPPGEVRQTYEGEEMTEADMVEAVRTLVANSGRYTWEGNQFTTEGYVTLNPNYMAAWGENHYTYTFRVEGDTLHVTWPGDFGPTEGTPWVGTFRRVG
jgi:hypothetical protein